MFRKTAFGQALATAVLSVTLSTIAQAAPVYGSVSTPPGVFFGSGNPNGNFWIDNSVPGLELALRAKNRDPNVSPLIDGSSGTYVAAPGVVAGTKASYNYEFSILSTGVGGIGGYQYRLGVDHDPSAAVSYSFVDPSTYWGDDAKYIVGSDLLGLQNSENVSFGDTPGGAMPGGPTGNYSFVLAAYALGVTDYSLSNALALTSINVQVPEPGSLALVGLALAGMAAAARRKRV